LVLKSLILNNYTVFEGRCEFDLETHDKDKNVIIIGGKNGAGKTSLLEGIRLCLYGAQGVSKRQGREYRAYLQSRINRNALRISPYAKAFVELQFVYKSDEQTFRSLTRRTWSTDSAEDSLHVEMNGKELTVGGRRSVGTISQPEKG